MGPSEQMAPWLSYHALYGKKADALNLTLLLMIALPALAGGIVQAVTGFGAGIIMMLFFPLVLPMLKASALSTLVTLYLTVSLAWKFRKEVQISLLLLPLAVFLICTTAALQLATMLDTRNLSLLFGIFLIALALYFIRFSNRIPLKPSPVSASACSGLSGLCSGMFGIGGPPMVVYYLAVLGDKKEAYLATTQMYFCIGSIYNTVMRACRGILTLDMLPLVAVGLAGMAAGERLGLCILRRIDVPTMKKAVYGLLAVSGVITLFRSLLGSP